MQEQQRHPLDGMKLPLVLQQTSCPSITSLINDDPSTSTATSVVTTVQTAATGEVLEESPRRGTRKRLGGNEQSPASKKRRRVPSSSETEEQQPEQQQQLPSPIDSHLTITSDASSSVVFKNYSALRSSSQSLFLLEFLKRSQPATLQLISSVLMPSLRRDLLRDLPRELSHLILIHLDLPSLCRASLVSRHWKHIVDGDQILWRHWLAHEGWEERMLRDVCLLQKAQSPLIEDQVIAAEARRFESQQPGQDVELLSPIQVPSWEALRRDPFILMPTLTQPRKRPLGYPHIFKLLYSHYFVMRRNWYTGRCSQFSFPANEDRVITNLIIDSRHIITGSDSNIIYAIDIQTGEVKRKLEGHDGGVWCLENCGPARNTVVSGCTDRTIRVWDMERGRCLQVLRGHSSTIRCLAVIPPPPVDPESPQSVAGPGDDQSQGKSYWVITGARDSTVRVWQVKAATVPTFTPSNPQDQPPPQGKHSRADDEWLTEDLITNRNHQPDVVNVDTVNEEGEGDGEEVGGDENGDEDDDDDEDEDDEMGDVEESPSAGFLFSLRGHEGSVRAIAAHGDTVVTASYDNTVRVWSLTSRKCLFRLAGHTNKIYSLVYDYRNDVAISGGMDSGIRVWNTKTGECLRVLEGHAGLVGLMQLEYLPYTPTGPRHKYNIQPRELFIPNIQNQSSSKNNFGGNGGGSRDMLSRKKPILVSAAADGVIKVWDPQENHVLHSFYGHRNAITCFQFDQDKLVSGGEGTVKLWDLRNGLFVRDMIADITGAWKVAINERYAVCAVQRANSETWFEVMDFAVPGSDIL